MARLDITDIVAISISGVILLGTVAAPHLAATGLLPEESTCLSQRIIGIECAGCGLTRSFIALGTGELERALTLNWMAPTLAFLAVLHVGSRLAKLARPSLRLRTFDLATIVILIVIHVARSIEIWG